LQEKSKMRIPFTKMHGLGNDFMVINATTQPYTLTKAQITALADRHFGVGFDQLLLLEASIHKASAFQLRIFNADGSESAQCGNGIRCIARFIAEEALANAFPLLLQIGAQRYQLNLAADGLVTANMQPPIFEPTRIPFIPNAEEDTTGIDTLLDTPHGPVRVQVLSMGNPHCVVFCDDFRPSLMGLGPMLSKHPQFPEQTNVELVQVCDRQHIMLRLYERGVGETKACGSGACAAVVAGVRAGLLDNAVQVAMPGGTLHVRWEGGDTPVWQTGPAVMVYEGIINFDL
jgi:diaminopimelate epimerase